MKIFACVVLSIGLFCQSAGGQNWFLAQRAKKVAEEAKSTKFADNVCIPAYGKGGIGIIHEDLYIVTKTTKNELILSGQQRWTGKDLSRPEVVFVFNDKVWSTKTVPERFDLSMAVVVSFEDDKARFFDFTKTQGCYYKRLREN